MSVCPVCRRPVAIARATCFYCGARLPDHLAARADETQQETTFHATAVPLAPGHTLVIVDLTDCRPETLVPLVSESRYEAELLRNRGGLHLHRVLPDTQATTEAERLRVAGIAATLVPEAEARVRPVQAFAGQRTSTGFAFRTEEGENEIAATALLLVVTGPIRRERQVSTDRLKIKTATLDEGWRVHLHGISEPRPIEIDAMNFEPGFAPAGSTRLELEAWLAGLGPGVRRDDGFRHLTPALAPTEPEAGGRLSSAAALLPSRRASPPTPRLDGSLAPPRSQDNQVLDNVAQFRFYSAWHAAVERRRRSAATDSRDARGAC